MPQMAPSMWYILYMMFIMSYIMFMLMIYFFNIYKSKKTSMNKLSMSNYINWKW